MSLSRTLLSHSTTEKHSVCWWSVSAPSLTIHRLWNLMFASREFIFSSNWFACIRMAVSYESVPSPDSASARSLSLLALRWHASLYSCRSKFKYCLFQCQQTSVDAKWSGHLWYEDECIAPLRTYWLGTCLLHSIFCCVWAHVAWVMGLIRL